MARTTIAATTRMTSAQSSLLRKIAFIRKSYDDANASGVQFERTRAARWLSPRSNLGPAPLSARTPETAPLFAPLHASGAADLFRDLRIAGVNHITRAGDLHLQGLACVD